MLVADAFFANSNYAEAVLWVVIGIIFAVVAVRRSGAARRRGFQAAFTFVVFGLSDVVEVQTGAWWRPWWLFAWKAACVLALVGLLIDYGRRGRSTKQDSGPAEPPSRCSP